MEDYEIQAAFDEFFNAKMSAELASVAADYPDERRSVEASFKALERYNTALADELLEHPDVCLTLAAKAIEAMNLPTASGKKFSPHVRVYNLPEQNTVTVQHLGAEHLNKLVSVDGTATLITQTFPRMSAALWECIHCEETVKTYPEKNAIAQPDVCRCGRRDFKLLEQSSEFINMQRSQIQDPVEKIKGNVPAPQVDLWLEDDLTNVISPGENVVITGILRLRPVPHSKGKPAQQGRNPVYSKFFDVVHVHKQKREFEELEITREEERKIIELSRDPRLFEKFIGSIAPSIYGYDELKEAIGLQLFGGTPNKVMPDGKKIRSDMHILLVGDPGTAKSSILQYIKDLAPKAIYVSGRGASGVGLTASAEKDELTDGGWVLKAGALVLASGGIVMIDEFDKMEKEDRSAIHEALEQQSYHPNTRMLLSDGSEKKIGAIVDALFDERKSEVVQGKNCELLSLKPGELKIFSSDFGKVFETSAIQASRHIAPEKMAKITLSNGRSITVTPEHPCWVIENGQMTTKPAEKITENDFLPIPAFIPLKGAEQEITARGIDGRTKKELLFEKFPKHNDADFCRFIGYLASDGGYELNRGQKNGVNFTNKDQALIEDFCNLSQKLFGLAPYVRKRGNGVQMARIISMPLLQYLECLDFGVTEKSDKKRIPPLLMKSSNADITHMLRALFESDGWATENRAGFISANKEGCGQVQTLLLRFGITSQLLEQKTSTGKLIWKVDVTGAENLRKFAEHIGFLSARKNEKLAKQLNPASFRTIKDIVPNVGNACAQIAETLKLNESEVLDYSITYAKKYGGNLSRHALQKFVAAFEQKLGQLEKSKNEIRNAKSAAQLKAIRETLCIAQEDIAKQLGTTHQQISYWESKNRNTDEIRCGLLGFIERINPNAAAQTAFLRKLAFGEIAWSKVKKTEAVQRDCKWVYDLAVQPTSSFVSECMLLHNSISIAKAGIVTQFKAKTSVLAAANPKHGRFDPMQPPASQFDIPPTLMSRFDLIFVIKDILDEARDRNLAEHILLGHKFAAEKTKPPENSGITPAIDLGLLRKYIAYARRKINPILTDEASLRIKDYYLELRRLGKKQNNYPVTAREIEGLIRLSEASAKLCLRDKVTLADAERAVKLAQFVLSEIFMDRETGRIDSDVINIGVAKSRIDKMRQLWSVIEALQAKFDLVDIDDIVKEATAIGLDEAYSRRLVEEMKRQGDLYEPKVGFVKSSRKKEW